MAGSRACRSLRQNSFPTGKDELAGAAPIKRSSTHISTFIMLHASTPAPATTLATSPSLNNKLFKQFIKAYLEA